MMKKKIIQICLSMALFILFTAVSAFAEGLWQKAEWIGSPEDVKGKALAGNFKVMLENKRMDTPTYDLIIQYGIGHDLSFEINKVNIRKNRPLSILWTGRYNGHNQEKETVFSGEGDMTQRLMFVCSSSVGNTPVNVYAVDGLVRWSEGTKRPELDKICIVWDSAMRTRVFVGKWFADLLKEIKAPEQGYYKNDNHN